MINTIADLRDSLQRSKRREEVRKELDRLRNLIDNGVAEFYELQEYRTLMREYVELGGSRRNIEKKSREWC